MSGALSRLALLVFCGALVKDRGADRVRTFLHLPPDAEPGLRLAAEDLRTDLRRLTGESVRLAPLPAPSCRAGEVHLVVLGHRHDLQGEVAAAPAPLASQEYLVEEQRCRRGRRVVMAGGSLLAGQWAVYELLEQVGVRFFHPEQTFYPSELRWPSAPISVRTRPTLARRSMHVHRDHPVELSPPLEPGGPPVADFQRRWIDWNVKLRQTLVDGWDEALVGDHAYRRGFPRVAGFNLANAQQGGRPVLNPDDPRSEAEQIARALDRLLAPRPGQPDVEHLSVQFNPSEFSEADEDRTVERLTTITRHLQRHYPRVNVTTINHGTAQAPVAKRKVRFFDLSAFAPPALGVMLHPLMFYDLERPAAGVYGNADFGYLRDFALREMPRRPIVHYPESSWWLTFDLAVPLYLAPVTLEARQHDLDLLLPHRPAAGQRTGFVGHHLFTSGQEWGYWLIDYCVARMTFDPAVTQAGCLDDFTAQLARGAELRQVLAEVQARQVVDLRDPEKLRFLVGSDDEVEAAAGLGVPFHPLPPSPAELAQLDPEAVAALYARSLRPLTAMAADYHAWANRVEGLLRAQSRAQAPWVREIRDGLRIFALRAEHAVAVAEGALAVRAARSRSGAAPVDRAPLSRALARARALTDAARQVVRRRENDYRYPAALTTAGGERGTASAIRNRTIYPYRYLARTHRLHYWTRPDQQLATLVRETLEQSGQPVLTGGRRVLFPRGSLKVEAPRQAQRLEGLLPGLAATLGDDGAPFLELAPVGLSDTGAAAWRAERQGSRSGPVDLPLTLRKLGELVIREARVEVETARRAAAARLSIRGRLRTEDIVGLMVKAGGFDAPGARVALALALGYTPAGIPESVPLALHADGNAL